MSEQDQTEYICNAVKSALEMKTPLIIHAGNTKSFYGNSINGEVLDVSAHRGIVDYEPSELFITARCGTPLKEIEAVLYEHNQMLSFEPPHFGDCATLGGTVACGFSGPRRPYYGAARDCILGAHIINGNAEYLRFGGQVMKNVAGYDTSRLMCGSLGTLAVLMQLSLKVIPRPQNEITLVFELPEDIALKKMNQWTQTDLPITATYFEASNLYIRVAGVEQTVKKVKETLGGSEVKGGEYVWQLIKEQQREFFNSSMPLWRLSIPSTSPSLDIKGATAMEWNGGLRWIKSEDDSEKIFSMSKSHQGYATLFRAKSKPKDCFQPLESSLRSLHTKIKRAFDPNFIFNPGRMYSWC